MTDFKESFEILEDPTTGDGKSPTAIEEGNTVSGRVGLIAFVAKDGSGNADILETTANGLKTDGSAVTQPISAASLPLPSGASTSANQTNKSQYTRLTDGTDDALVTAAGELNVIATAQPGVDIGDVTVNNPSGAGAVNIQDGGNSITVDGTVSANQSGTWNINDISGTISLPTGASTSALQTTGNSSLNSIDTKTPALGQATMANSTPVAIASDQSNVPVNLTQLSGATPSATNSLPNRLTDGTTFYDARQIRALTNTDVVKAQLQDNAGTAIVLGQTTMSASLPVVPASDWTERPTFTVYATAIAPALNKSMVSLANAGGSGIVLKIREIFIFNQQTGAVTGTINDFRLFKFTTHSAGTTLTPDPHDTNDTLNVNVTARTGGTIVGEATRFLKRWLWSSDEFGSGTADAETQEHTIAQTIGYMPNRFTKPISIRPGEGAHIKQTVSTTAGAFDLVIVFTQETA